MDFAISLRSDLIELRPLQMDDVEPLSVLTKSEKLWTYFTSNLDEPLQLKRWVSEAVIAREKLDQRPFAVIELGTNQLIGSTRFGSISERDQRVEIGWTWLGEEYHGKGYNKDMKLLMLQHCFESQGMERVEFKTDVLNMSARKAFEKIGIKEEGVLRSHTLLANGRRRDSIFYSVLRSEWEKVKSDNGWS